MIVPVGEILGCLLVADLVSGLAHWAQDTYLEPGHWHWINEKLVYPNIAHHRIAGASLANDYWRTNSAGIALTLSVWIAAGLMHLLDWRLLLIGSVASHANQVHTWAHSPAGPKVVRLLQKWGVLLRPAHHARHHKKPYLIRYCTIGNFLNPILDTFNFWRSMEAALSLCGIHPKRGSALREGY